MNINIFEYLGRSLKEPSSIPLYIKMGHSLESLIEKGLLLPGQKLPGEQELGEILKINHQTVRKAMKGLIDKNLIIRTRRAGTFVSEKIVKKSQSVGFFYFIENETRMLRRAEHLQQRLASSGFDVKVMGFSSDFFDKVNLVREMQTKDLCGAVIVPLPGSSCRNAFLDLEAIGFPHVRLGNSSWYRELRAPVVTSHRKQGFLTALSHLRELGHSRIGFTYIGDAPQSENESLQTYFDEGYKDHEQWTLPLNYVHLRQLGGDPVIVQQVRKFLTSHPELTGLIAQDGQVLLDFLEVARELGIRVPTDLSVICLHDWLGFEATYPPTTAVAMSDKEMGETAADLLLNLIQMNPVDRYKKKVLPTLIESRLILRGSTGYSGQIKQPIVNSSFLVQLPVVTQKRTTSNVEI